MATKTQQSNAKDAPRFTMAEDGTVQVTSKIPFAEFADLPLCVTDFTAEIIAFDITDKGREGFALMLRALCHLMPDELEQRKLHRQLNGK